MKIDEEKLQAERVIDANILKDKMQQMADAMSALRLENMRLKIENFMLKNAMNHENN